MGLKTPLFKTHQKLGARIVPFGGWDMPLHYGSQLREHHRVRRDAGMFDVSHMTPVDITGEQARALLRYLLANDVARLQMPGKALYSCMLNAQGGVIDDLIVYFIDESRFRLVVNAATTEKDLAWIGRHADSFNVEIVPRRDLAMIAVQGPNAREKAIPLLPQGLQQAASELQPFYSTRSGEWFVGRTGYTGEDGLELMIPAAEAAGLWNELVDAKVEPCGLGARDTLRLEAGMNLYGSDMDEETLPLEAGLGWTIAWDPPERRFIGREMVDARRRNPENRKFVGLILGSQGVLRNRLKLFSGDKQIGEITSGGFAPTLERSIALARVEATTGECCEVEIRGRRLPVQLVKPPFVRKGKVLIEHT